MAWHADARRPALEETADGAKAMLADHLYERFGRPDRAGITFDAILRAG